MPGHCRSVAGIKCTRVRRTFACVLWNGKVHLVWRVSAVGIAPARRVHRNIELHLVASPTAVGKIQSQRTNHHSHPRGSIRRNGLGTSALTTAWSRSVKKHLDLPRNNPVGFSRVWPL